MNMVNLSAFQSNISTQNEKSRETWNTVHSCPVTQSCPTLCDLMDCTLPSSSVHGILHKNTGVGSCGYPFYFLFIFFLIIYFEIIFGSVQFSHLVLSESLPSHGLQHTGLPILNIAICIY